MSKQLKVSKFLHWLTFLCLTLPFYFDGCGTKPVEREIINQDSTIIHLAKVDSLRENNDAETSQLNDSTNDERLEKKPSQKLSEEYPLLKPVLIPKESTYTGFAEMIDTFEYLKCFGTLLFVLFLLVGLVLKYVDKTALASFTFIDLISLTFLLTSEPAMFNFDRLWGFWVTLSLVVILTVYDTYSLIKNRK